MAVTTTPSGMRTYRGPLRTRIPYRTGGFNGPWNRPAAERKVIDVAQTNTPVNTTGSVTLLNGVATGDDFTERDGRKILLTALQLRGVIYRDTTAQSNNPDLVRVMVVEDLQANGAAPAVTDILKTAEPTSFMNMNNRDRFKVHFDKQVALTMSAVVTTNTLGGATVNNIKFYKKLNSSVTFQGTAATVASIATSAFYLVTVGLNAGATSDSHFVWSSRMRFIDA